MRSQDAVTFGSAGSGASGCGAPPVESTMAACGVCVPSVPDLILTRDYISKDIYIKNRKMGGWVHLPREY